MNRGTKARGVVKIKHDLSTSQLLLIFVQKLTPGHSDVGVPDSDTNQDPSHTVTAMTAQSLLDVCFGGEPVATPNCLASRDVWIILDLRDFLFTCLVQNQVERAALDGFPRLGAGIEFPGVWKTYETLQGGGSLDIGLATENHGKITWEKVDTIGKHVRNLVGFAILFGSIDGFVWFRT